MKYIHFTTNLIASVISQNNSKQIYWLHIYHINIFTSIYVVVVWSFFVEGETASVSSTALQAVPLMISYEEQVKCDLTSICGLIPPIILAKLELTFLCKFVGPACLKQILCRNSVFFKNTFEVLLAKIHPITIKLQHSSGWQQLQNDVPFNKIQYAVHYKMICKGSHSSQRGKIN